MTTRAEIRHTVVGRTRLRLPDRRGDSGYLRALAAALADAPGVVRVEVNPPTGGVLIRHEPSTTQAIWQWAAQTGWFTLDAPSVEEDAVVDRLTTTYHSLRERIGAVTGIDSRTVVFVILMALAIRQAIMGQIMAPAVTLLWYALNTTGFPGRGNTERSG